jgi:hypothetical protein
MRVLQNQSRNLMAKCFICGKLLKIMTHIIMTFCVFPSAQLSHTFSVNFNLDVRDKILHQYQTEGKILVLYILTFMLRLQALFQ